MLAKHCELVVRRVLVLPLKAKTPPSGIKLRHAAYTTPLADTATELAYGHWLPVATVVGDWAAAWRSGCETRNNTNAKAKARLCGAKRKQERSQHTQRQHL